MMSISSLMRKKKHSIVLNFVGWTSFATVHIFRRIAGISSTVCWYIEGAGRNTPTKVSGHKLLGNRSKWRWLTIVIFCFVCRRDEAASRPKGEFVPKSLAELNIDGIGDVLGNGGRHFTSNSHKSNHPSSNTKFNNNHKNYESSNKNNLFNNKTNNNISNNNNNQYNLFSSQQNLAKTNIIHSSNFARSRTYGSQQSLSTASNHSSSSSHRTNNNNDLLLNFNSTTSSSTTNSSYASNNRANGSNHYPNSGPLNDINAIPTDVWLNAWNSPPPVTRAPNTMFSSTYGSNMAATAALQSNHLTTTSTASNKNHFSNLNSQNGHINDPWTGEFYFPSFFPFRSSNWPFLIFIPFYSIVSSSFTFIFCILVYIFSYSFIYYIWFYYYWRVWNYFFLFIFTPHWFQ